METEANIPEDESATKTIPEEGYSMTENKSSIESSTLAKPPTEYICKSKYCQVDKIENQTFKKISEDETQHQKEVQSKDVETGATKVEAINDIDIEEPDHHTEKDGAKISRQACPEEPITNQHASSKVIAESIEKEMTTFLKRENTRSKGEEDADLECNDQATSISEANLGLINEGSLPNLDLTTKSQVEEDERVVESCIKDEDIDTTIHVKDEFKEISLDGVQKKEDMPSLLEGEWKDPESIGSSDKLERENNREEDASTVNVEEFSFEVASKNGENVNDKLENSSSDLVTDEASTQVAIEAGETLQEVSSTVCRDKNKDIYEDSRINPEKHDEENRDSQQKNEQEEELGEQVILITEKSEIAASRENAKKRVEQNIHPVENFEEKEERDEQISTPRSEETSISIEKILPLAESITKIKSEETLLPQRIVNDLNSEDPLVEETRQPDNHETGEVPKIEAQEKHQESSKFFTKNNEQDEHLSETHSTENLVIKHMDSEAMVITETTTKSTKDTEEHENVLDSHSENKIDIKGDEKIIPEEPKEREETIDKQLLAKESVTKDEDPSRLTTIAFVRDETIEQSYQEEGIKDNESTLIEKNERHRPENDAGENKKAIEAFELPNTIEVRDIYKQQIIEGSVEETLDKFQDNEKEIQNLRDDPHREIKGENYGPDLPVEFIQNTKLERYSTTAQLYSNLNECSPVEFKSSAESSSSDKSPTENICKSKHFQDEKIKNQILREESENERQHQKGVQNKDVQTGADKVEALKDKIIEEPDHDIENDVAKISMLASAEKPNRKVHEEETSMDNSYLDQHPELITNQHASFKAIPESIEQEVITSPTNENTTSKREEDADLECNEQATSILKRSCIKNEDIDTTIHVEDEFKEISLTGIQNEEAEIPSVLEREWKDPEPIWSIDKLEHENNEEFKLMTGSTEDASTVNVAQIPYIQSVEESTFEAILKNGDNDNDKLENPSPNLVADGVSIQVAIEAGETIQKASYTACQDKNKDIYESVRQEIYVPLVDGIAKVEDLACLNRDMKGENEEDIIQMGLREIDQDSKINPETHDGEKIDLWQKNEQEYKLREQSLPLVEPITEINDEERIFPQQIANDLNSNYQFLEETRQPDNGEIDEVSKTGAQEEHQELSKFCAENSKQDKHHPETQSTENLVIKHMDSEAMVMTKTVSGSTKDTEELEKVPLSYSEEKINSKGDEKIIPEEPKEMEEATDKQLHENARESISEDQAPSRLPITALIRDETIEQSIEKESLKEGESTLIEKNESHRAENDAKEKIKAVEAFDLPKTRQDIYEQQIIGGSVQGTMHKFLDNEKEIEDTSSGGNYVLCMPSEFNQNTELEERYSTTAQSDGNPNKCSPAEFESSVDSSSLEKSLIEKMFKSEHFQVAKIENQALEKLSENERQYQKGLLSKDVEIGGGKVEAINDTNIELDHDKENDGAKISMLVSTEESNLKVHKEKTFIEDSFLDQHLEVITNQHVSFEVIPKSIEKEIITSQTNENTTSKKEEDADLECNEQVTSIYETILGKINEASLPNLDLATKSKGEEDERVIESFTKDEDIETTKHVKDELKDPSLIGVQNKKSEMPPLLEGEWKDPKSIGSSNKLEHENNREQDASSVNVAESPYVHSVEESTFEAASKNGDSDDDKSGNPSSNLATDEASTKLAIEAGETLQEASYTAYKDKSKDASESVWPEIDIPLVDRMAKARDSACLDRFVREANEEDINQVGLTEINEDSRINPETHDGEKRDSLQQNDQEYEPGEQAILIPKKTETAAPREDVKKRVEQNIHPVKNFEEKEKSDEKTSTPESRKTSISTEKSLPFAESITKIKCKETIFPQKIANDIDSKDPLVADSSKFDIGKTGEESQAETQEKIQELSKFCTKNNKQDEQRSETQSTENLVIKHMDSEAMVTTKTITKSTNNTEELDRIPESRFKEKLDIKGDEKILLEVSKEMEEATAKQLHEIAKESVFEDEAPSRLPTTVSVGDEKIEQSFQEESPKDDATLPEKKENYIPENNAEKDKKTDEASDLPKIKGGQDINEQQIIEGSIEETMNNFQDNEKKNQNLREDTGKEIEGQSSVPDLPSKFIQHGITDETILCESDQNEENPEIVFGMSSKKEEQSLLGEHGNPTPKEALIKDQDEYAYSMNVAENNTQASRENSDNTTCIEGEETIARLEKFSQKEKMEEEPKDLDGRKENKASYQEVPVTTASNQETIENLLKVSEPLETEAFVSKPKEEIEDTVGTLSSTSIGTKIGKEYLDEEESEETKSKEEVKVIESKGKIEATYSIDKKISDDLSKPKVDHDVLTIEGNNTLVKDPSSVLGVPEKDKNSTNDSETEFLKVVGENTTMKEVKPIDEDHLEGSNAAHKMMDLTTTKTKSNWLGSDIAERQKKEANSEENRDMKVREVEDQGEQISHDIRDKNLITGVNHEKELTITDDQSVHTVLDSFMVPSNGESKTTEMSKITENTLARGDILYVEIETPLITHTEGALMLGSSDNEKGKKKEYSNEGIQKHKDGDQPMPSDLKTENIISESDTKDIVKEKIEQADSLADQNKARKIEIVECEKSTIEVTRALLQEEELTDKTEDSSVTRVEREAVELKTASSSGQEKFVNTKTSELLMEKGDFVPKVQSEEILLHSSNNQIEGKDDNLQDQDSQSIQEVIQLKFEDDTESNLKPRYNDEDHLNSSFDQDGNTNAIKFTQEVEVSTSKVTEQIESTKLIEGKRTVTLEDQIEQNMDIIDFNALKSTDISETSTEATDNNENIIEHPTGGRITSFGEEIENEVAVSTSKLTEQIESTKLTEEKKSVPLEDRTKQNMDITDFSASKSTDASETGIEAADNNENIREHPREGRITSPEEETENEVEFSTSKLTEQIVSTKLIKEKKSVTLEDQTKQNMDITDSSALKSTNASKTSTEATDNNENIKEHSTEGRITSPEQETENEVEVSTSKLTEQIESTKLTEEPKFGTLEDQTEQNVDITNFNALKSTDTSETSTEDSFSTPKVYEKETEAGFVKKDDSNTDDPKNVPLIVEIEEIGLKNARTRHIEYDKGSDKATENKGEIAIATDQTTSDSIDIVRSEENFNSKKKGILEELNEGHLKVDSCVEEIDRTTTVQHEREPAISIIPMSQDYPILLVEEKDAIGNAIIHPMDARSTREKTINETTETYLVHSIENTLFQKEHEVVKSGGVPKLESVNITEECPNKDSSQLENEVKEEKLLIEASKCTTSSTCEDRGAMQRQDNLGTPFKGNLTNVATEKAETALETKDFSYENESTDEFPSEKTVEVADSNEKVELAFESTAKDQSDEKIYQAKEESNSEDHIFESRENVPNQKFQVETQREVDMQFEVKQHISVPGNVNEASMIGGYTESVTAATEKANGSENILEHSPELTSNLKESDTLSVGYEIINEATATNSGFIEQIEEVDLVQESKSRILENLAKANEDFSSLTTIEASEEGIHKEECKKTLFRKSSMGSHGLEKDNKAEISNKEDNTNIFESLPCMHERKDVTTTDKVKTSLDAIDTDNIQEESSSLEDSKDKQSPEIVDEGRCEMDHDTRGKAPITGDEYEKEENANLTLIQNDNLQNPSVIQTEDGPGRKKFSNSIDNLASDDQTYKNAEIAFVACTAEAKLPQSNHNVIKHDVSPNLETAIIHKENENKEIQKQKDEDIHDLNSQGTISATKDVKISRTETGSGVTDQNGAGTLEEVKDQKPCMDISGANDEQDAENFRSSSKIVKKTATESDPGGQSNKHESTKTEESELPAEKILKPDNLGKKFESTSNSKVQYETNEQLPQTKEKSNNSQACISQLDEQFPGIKYETEKQRKLEPHMEAKHQLNIPPHVKETSVTSLITKEVHEGVDRAGESEKIDKQIINYEVNSMELQILFDKDDTINQDIHSYEVLTELEDKARHVKTEENKSETITAIGETINTQVSDEKVKEGQEAAKDFQQIYTCERGITSNQEIEQSAIEYPIKKTNTTFQIISNENQHQVKSEATEKREYENIKDNLPDDTEGKNVMEAATWPTHENRGIEPKITGRRTEVMAQGEKDQELEAKRSQKGHMDTAEQSESPREIQKLEESLLGALDIKLTVRADAETRETNEGIEQGLQNTNGETIQEVQSENAKSINTRMEGTQVEEENISSSTEEPLQVPTHLHDATKLTAKTQKGETPHCEEPKTDIEKEEGVDENRKIKPLSGASVMVETSKDMDAKVAHKKSHNILSRVGSKVKHLISKVKKAITGKSSHPKTPSPK